MSDDELEQLAQQGNYDEHTMHSACSDYACSCHFKVPKLVAEVRRLRTVLAEVREMTGDPAVLRTLADPLSAHDLETR